MASVCGLSHGMLSVCTGFAESQVKKQACGCEAEGPFRIAAPVSPPMQAGGRSEVESCRVACSRNRNCELYSQLLEENSGLPQPAVLVF